LAFQVSLFSNETENIRKGYRECQTEFEQKSCLSALFDAMLKRMESKEALIALNMLDHIGPVRLKSLLGIFGSPEAILAASIEQLIRVQGIGQEAAQAIREWEDRVDLSGELCRIRESGVTVLDGNDPLYPPLLHQIYDPPIVLYVKGSLLEKDRNAVAIVGSRRTTAYGQESARRLAYQLAYIGVTVVSGGARGVDTAAHQGALSAKGRTISVLGTGIEMVDTIQPTI
jgi:DNA processing protein